MSEDEALSPTEMEGEEPMEAVEEPSTEKEKEEEKWYCKDHGEVTPRWSSGRAFCPHCGKLLRKTPYEEKEEEEVSPLPPTESEMVQRVKELLAKYLPRVYGIPKKESSKRILAIIDTINSTVAQHPANLHNHIKTFAPNADDRHLQTIISLIYSQLQEEGYLPKQTGVFYPQYQIPMQSGMQTVNPYYNYYPTYQTNVNPYLQTMNPYTMQPTAPVQPQTPQPIQMPQPVKPIKPKKYTLVIDGQQIETYDPDEYRAWLQYKQEKEERELRLKKIEAEILKVTKEAEAAKTEEKKEEELVPLKIGDSEIKVPASQATLYLLLKGTGSDKEVELREKLAKAEAEIKHLEEKVKEEKSPPLSQQIQTVKQLAEILGYRQSGRTTADILDKGIEKFHETVSQALSKFPAMSEFKPEVTRTPEQRRQKVEELKRRLKASEDVIKAEDELIKAFMSK